MSLTGAVRIDRNELLFVRNGTENVTKGQKERQWKDGVTYV